MSVSIGVTDENSVESSVALQVDSVAKSFGGTCTRFSAVTDRASPRSSRFSRESSMQTPENSQWASG